MVHGTKTTFSNQTQTSIQSLKLEQVRKAITKKLQLIGGNIK